jgi:catechol 2,3-dioxygenase-like lactoylglutathione lyase family enzyme
MEKIICGIQQMGIGVPNVNEVWAWYRLQFGIDIKIFEEAAEAPLMTKYTGDKVQSRTATLALSMDGGGGFEIWQYTSRNTEKASFAVQMGDYGIYACKIKSRDILKSFEYMTRNKADILGPPTQDALGCLSYFLRDPNGNLFQVVESKSWFSNTKHPSHCGGMAGAIIGVSDMEKSIDFYQGLLNYDELQLDETGVFEDFSLLDGGNRQMRRVRISHKNPRRGPFAQLLGTSQLELIQLSDNTNAKSIFQDRMWGDWGFIHLCFDVQGMDVLKQECADKGFAFTVDSAETFDMGEAGGRFSYVEDPDGSLIEFVETHKVPVIKKIGWYIHLKNKAKGKFLPRWMLLAMSFNRVK